jgi:ABC-type transport system involved in multi-copper enzyme maturation permease subunit
MLDLDIAAIFIVPLVLIGGMSRAPQPVLAALVAAEVALVGWALRRRHLALVGPLFFYDVVRLARRGRSTLLRCTYALLLLMGLYVVFTQHFPGEDPFALTPDPHSVMPIQEMARFAQTFVTTFLVLQSVAVLVLTPAYLAGAIAEEKDRRTLDLLFTTQLGDHEIVLGKLCARWTHLAGLLLTGLPVLALAQFWGGVDVVMLVATFAVTGLTLFSVGGVSILCSVLARTALAAVVSSYTVSLALLICCLMAPSLSSPITFMLALDERINRPDPALAGSAAPQPGSTAVAAQMVGEYGLVHGLIALACIAVAVVQVRKVYLVPTTELPAAPRLRATVPPDSTLERAWPMPAPVPEHQRILGFWRPRPVGHQPLLWKEIYQGLSYTGDLMDVIGMTLVVPLCLGLLIFGGMALASLTDSVQLARVITDVMLPTIRWLGLFVTAAWCVGVGFRAAAAVSRERDQHTLDTLLTLPVEREAILDAKWQGSILRLRQFGYYLAVLWGIGLLTSALHPLAAVLLLLACAAHIAFVASVCLWLSLVCRNMLWANFTTALVLLLFFAGSWIALGFGVVSPGKGDDWTSYLVALGLNPLRTWWTLAFSWHDLGPLAAHEEKAQATLTGLAAGLVCFAAAALAYWLLACQRFRQEQTQPGR